MKLTYIASFGDHIPLSQFKPDDTISVLSFHQDGQFLASGDHAGRVVIFQLIEPKSSNGKPTVQFVTQVHAHKPWFDYFRSELVEPKINSLKWVRSVSANPLFLTCNSHDAKIWRLSQTSKANWNPFHPTSENLEEIVLPTPRQNEIKYTAKCLNTFTDYHTEYLVDLQTMTDQTSFVMIDVGCVKLWDIERSIPSVTLYQFQQQSELTSSAYSPHHPSSIIVSDDCGIVRLLDMRNQAEDLTPSQTFKIADNLDHALDGCEYICSINCSSDGNYIVARTFCEAQVWDIRKSDKPVISTQIQWFGDQMDWMLSDEYNKDCFRSSITSKGKVVTGCYSADFVTWDFASNNQKKHQAISNRTPVKPPEAGKDLTKRVTAAEAHPTKEIVAVVSTAALFVYSETE